jgi:hypothetical protein
MAATKDRKVFAFNNFRGLDKENKPLKVAAFRASDGYNFIIDSDTLKTRPAIQSYSSNISIYLDANEVVLDWYEYRNIEIYITNTHFRVFYNGSHYSQSNLIFVKQGVPNSIDWSNKKPMFKEEKDVLFIFGLDKVYVFAIDFQGSNIFKLFLYDIANKPNNPYDPTLEKTQYEFFQTLPYSYVPTLFIGNNAFEDLNNLSNSYKYNLFAEASDFNTEGFSTYYLPTHYEENKHDSYTYEVEFYNNTFGDLDALPFYLGINNELVYKETVYDQNVHGTKINESSPVVVIDTFYPKEAFEYYTDLGSTPTITTIKQQFNLDKKTFFNFRVAGDNRTVFEYTMNYLKTQDIIWATGTNQILLFRLPVEFDAIYKNVSGGATVEITREKANVLVYIQLRRFEDEATTVVNQGVVSNTLTTENSDPEDYPVLYDSGLTYNIDNFTTPISLTVTPNNFTNVYAQNIARSWLLEQDLSGGTIGSPKTARVAVRLEYQEVNTTPAQYQDTYDYYSCTGLITYFIQNNSIQTQPPSLPNSTFQTNPESDIIQIDSLSIYSGIIDLDDPSTAQEISIHISNKLPPLIPTLVESSGYVFIKLPLTFIDLSTQYQPSIYTQFTPVFKYYFQKSETTTVYTRMAAIYNAEYFSIGNLVIEELFDLQESVTFPNNFELKVKDYFFDYTGEPSIKVTVTHTNNPDYSLIANSTFGINFGSENRFFLAGNPNFPNIDRYNVSNDLLGINERNQSYELSYFPSKNYRVVGGKGAINGYVIATDSQLYVTKVDYPNDDKLFIRERILNENGVVGYREFKTNISKTPINEKCIVRFYNDILILSNDGLYAIEISSNVLTNERLLKLRSGFINKDLKQSIINATNAPYIVENNYYMYIIIDDDVYVADSRYVANNQNGTIDNQSYEIVKWKLNNIYNASKITETNLFLMDTETGFIYSLVEGGSQDQKYDKFVAGSHTLISDYAHTFTSEMNDLFYANPQKYSFKFSAGQRHVAYRTSTGFSYANNIITVIDDNAFASITDGDVIILHDQVTNPSFVVSGFEASNRTTISIPISYTETPAAIRVPASVETFYIIDKWIYNGAKYFAMTYIKPETVNDLGTLQTQLPSMTQTNKTIYGGVIDSYSLDTLVQFLWVSNVTDLGNNLMEKTMFRLNVYATKQENENSVNIGFKTMRRLQQAEETNTVRITDQIDLSNPNSFDDVNFVFYALNTFNEMGTSIPAKENNFLYIQFLVTGQGAIELNSIQMIYKNNRMLKSIG